MMESDTRQILESDTRQMIERDKRQMIEHDKRQMIERDKRQMIERDKRQLIESDRYQIVSTSRCAVRTLSQRGTVAMAESDACQFASTKPVNCIKPYHIAPAVCQVTQRQAATALAWVERFGMQARPSLGAIGPSPSHRQRQHNAPSRHAIVSSCHAIAPA
jgi:hypothetical protein